MAERCEACGKSKRTMDQIAGREPCGDTCTTWLLARPTKGARAVGCGLDAYRKLLEAQAKLTKLEAERDAMVAASRAVVAADTYPMPGKTRFEATTEAIGKLEALLSQTEPVAAKAELPPSP